MKRRAMVVWWCRGMTRWVVLNAAMWCSWFSRIRQGVWVGNQSKPPSLMTRRGRPARPKFTSRTAPVNEKKPTNSELPAWLLLEEPHLHLATTLPRKAGWCGLRPNSEC